MERGGKKIFEVSGICLEIPDMVWPPYRTGIYLADELMLQYQHIISGGTVVDIGTGSGLLAIKAAKLGARNVVALDLNAEAVQAVQSNWATNGLNNESQNLLALTSDGFAQMPETLKRRVDLIIANPPVQPMILSNGDGRYLDRSVAHAWNEAKDNGRAVLDTILVDGPSYLKEGGVILTTTTTRHGWKATQEILEQQKLKRRIENWRVIHSEVHRLANFYDQYIPIWTRLQEIDGDVRIWRDEEGIWNHRFIVLEIQ